MSHRTRAWPAIAIGVGVGAVALMVFVGVSLFSLVDRHVRESRVASGDAQSQVAAARQRLNGRQPLVEIRDGAEPVTHPVSASGTTNITVFRAIVYEAPSGRLIAADIPIAVLRFLKGDGFKYLGELTATRGETEFERDKIDISLRDIESHGNLIVDHQHSNGSQVIAWVE